MTYFSFYMARLWKGSIFFILIIIFLLPTALAETITFSDLGIATEFSSGKGGTTKIGTFYSPSNEYPLEITVNTFFRDNYALTIYLNDAPVNSGNYRGAETISVKVPNGIVKKGNNTIYIGVTSHDIYPFGSYDGNFFIYGTSKISSPGIILVSTPTPTPTPSPIETPILVSNPILTSQVTPIQTINPPISKDSQSDFTTITAILIIIIILVSFSYYLMFLRKRISEREKEIIVIKKDREKEIIDINKNFQYKINSKDNKIIKLESELKKRGFVEYTNRFGIKGWGTKEEIEKDTEMKRKDSLYNKVIDEIKNFCPSKNSSSEDWYHAELLGVLKAKYPAAKAGFKIGASIPDIVIENIAIEVKGPTYSNDLVTLADKCLRYTQHYDRFIIVLFEPSFTEQNYNEFINGMKRHFPDVEVIRKDSYKNQDKNHYKNNEEYFNKKEENKQSNLYYYRVLGVNKNSNLDEIKNAYRSLVKIYHPDISADIYTEKKFREIQMAYEVLSDPEKRAQYDRFEDVKL